MFAGLLTTKIHGHGCRVLFNSWNIEVVLGKSILTRWLFLFIKIKLPHRKGIKNIPAKTILVLSLSHGMVDQNMNCFLVPQSCIELVEIKHPSPVVGPYPPKHLNYRAEKLEIYLTFKQITERRLSQSESLKSESIQDGMPPTTERCCMSHERQLHCKVQWKRQTVTTISRFGGHDCTSIRSCCLTSRTPEEFVKTMLYNYVIPSFQSKK